MWGSHGEFVIDGNLQTVEYVDQLPTLHVPTLILAGDHDECDSSLARLMHDKIEGSELVILPNAGHMAFEDQPELWIRSVREFLNRSGE
jgi:pimeloyl-ACP methyl ester carboxylesterase